jgi:hypothetical protein
MHCFHRNLFDSRALVIENLIKYYLIPFSKEQEQAFALCLTRSGAKITARVNRVARWFVFMPKIQIFVTVFKALEWKTWYILWAFGIFKTIWCI